MHLRGPVLIGTDLTPPSAEALRQAHRLAVGLSTSLIVCHVLPEFPSVQVLFPQWAGTDAEAHNVLVNKARAAVEQEIVQTLGKPSGDLTVVFDTGTAHAGLLRQAESTGAGLVVVGPGRVADLVVRHATVPVLIARHSPRGDVIGATDFSDPSLPALDTAAFEARRRASRLHLVHVVDIGPYAISAGSTGSARYLGGAPALHAVEQLRIEAQQQLQNTLRGLAIDGQAVAVSGSTIGKILDLAESTGAELIVVGTHGRSGFARLTLGSTSEAIVRSAPCSVLVVRLGRAVPVSDPQPIDNVATTTKAGGAGRRPLDEIIDEASRESFPASDPPSWTLGVRAPFIRPKPDRRSSQRSK